MGEVATVHQVIVANAVVFGILFAIWDSKGWFNMLCKVVTFGMLALNFYLLVK